MYSFASLFLEPAEPYDSECPLLGSWELCCARHEPLHGRNCLCVMGHMTHALNGHVLVALQYIRSRSDPNCDVVPLQKARFTDSRLVAYAGRFALLGNVAIHYVQVATKQQLIGRELVSRFRVENNQLTVTGVDPVSPRRNASYTWMRYPLKRRNRCA